MMKIVVTIYERDIYSCSNREASITEALVISVADQQYFRWFARIATQRKP